MRISENVIREDERRQRLIASLCVFTGSLIIVGYGLLVLQGVSFYISLAFQAGMMGLILGGLGYLLTRTRWWRQIGLLLIIFFEVIIPYALLVTGAPQKSNTLTSYYIIPTLMASMLLSKRATLFITISNLLITCLLYFSPNIQPYFFSNTLDGVGYVLIIGFLVILEKVYRDDIANIRLDVLEQAHQSLVAERQRIGRELHDSMNQLYVAGLSGAEALEQRFADLGMAEDQALAVQTKQMFEGMSAEVRILLVEIEQDSIFGTRSLERLLKPLLTRMLVAGQQVESEVIGEGILVASVKQHIYRIVQEALANSFRHSQAKKIKVSCHYNAQSLHLLIRDDGLGFDLEQGLLSGGLGLRNMLQRAEKMGADLKIDTALGAGVTIELIWEA